ncbi:MAG: T9SS C-terminal target domain-containing protein [Bacteroidetes bacterium]|nr:MAG: T9SS C-terminal target domain-containing protein [Bacteroidota bacterium]
MKKIIFNFALAIGLLAFSTAQAQNMSRYITLTVKNGAKIKLKLNAATDGTPVKIKSGSNEQIVTVNKAQGTFNYTATDTIMTVYGDVTIFHCNYNKANITALDPSHNTGLLELNCSSDSIRSLDVTKNTSLTLLDCYSTRLSTLDVTKNTELAKLFCGSNKLSSLDVTKNTKLTKLRCFFNNLSTLDVTKNTQLVELNCHSNRFTSLDVTNNTMLKELICRDNRLTSLDIRRNTQLEKLHCYGNAFSTASLDTIFCSLPDRLPADMAKICPLVNDSDPNKAIVLATNKQNAIAKNWKVQYQSTSTDIPATTGSYVCSNSGGGNNVNMSSYIKLTVKNGELIKLDFKATAPNTHVKIKSGSHDTTFTVGTDWLSSKITYRAANDTVTAYGDITGFSCKENGANITALDPSHNIGLTELYCNKDSIRTLDVSQNALLEYLDCSENRLSGLDVTQNTQLTNLYCFFNQLTALDVTKNTALTELSCSSNQLSSLDISKNTELLILNCKDNKLTSLDISKNTKLKMLYCSGNNFSTQALDDIYCALPDKKGKENGVIHPVKNSSDPNHATILATNKTNATAKNWKVRYYDDTDIPATTGNYNCSGVSTDIAIAEPQFTFYPNPVSDILYLSATARTIRIYNIYGIEVAHAADTDRVEVSHLPAGVYTVKANGTLAKMIKR